MIALCGIGDGAGKICGARIGVTEIDPYGDPERRFFLGKCAKHDFVAVPGSQFDRAEAAGQKAVLLLRAGGVASEAFGRIAHRAPGS